ncbi:response regulator [Aliamphritea spongicola]
MQNTSHILVVDDHQDIRDLVARYLTEHGYRVTTAKDGKSMKAVLNSSAVDLVILDVMMPGEDGLSLCRHLREQGQLPVIMLTAMTEQTDRVVGLEMGADDYLTKPFFPGSCWHGLKRYYAEPLRCRHRKKRWRRKP